MYVLVRGVTFPSCVLWHISVTVHNVNSALSVALNLMLKSATHHNLQTVQCFLVTGSDGTD